jgi:hypothetical protein
MDASGEQVKKMPMCPHFLPDSLHGAMTVDVP